MSADKNVQIAQITARQAILVAIVTAVSGLVGSIITARLKAPDVPRQKALDIPGQTAPTPPEVPRQHRLEISGVELQFAGSGSYAVRVVAQVNGQAYSYPSTALWADVAPGMSHEEFPLAVGAEEYGITFQVFLRDPAGTVSRLGSHEEHMIPVTALPMEREYRLYVQDSGFTRSGHSELLVKYRVH
jgi:hypothetical protein